MLVKKYSLQQHGDERGQLVAFEEMKDIPFRIKRVYYMFDVHEGVKRAKHSHKKADQLLVCLHGSVKIELDDGDEKELVVLDNPDEGLYLEHNIWREMSDFEEGTVLMAFVSEYSDDDDYVGYEYKRG